MARTFLYQDGTRQIAETVVLTDLDFVTVNVGRLLIFDSADSIHGVTVGTGLAVVAGALTATGVAPPDGSVTDPKIGNRTIDDTTSHASATGTLTQLLSLLGKLIKGITGKASFLTAPATTLEAANTHYGQKASPVALGHVMVGQHLAIDGTGLLSTTGLPEGSGLTARVAFWANATTLDDADMIVGTGTGTFGSLGFGITPATGIVEVLRSDAWSGVFSDHSGGGNGIAVWGLHSTGAAVAGEATTGYGGDFLATGAAGVGLRARATNSTGTAFQLDGNLNLVPESTKIAAYTLQRSDILVGVSTNPGAAFTITLPALSTCLVGDIWIIEDTGGQLATRNVTLARAGADVFKDTSTSKALATNNGTCKNCRV